MHTLLTTKYISVILCTILTCGNAQTNEQSFLNNVHYLHQGDIFKLVPSNRFSPKEFHIFCYQGKPKYIIHIWQSVLLHIKHSTDDYTQFDGNDPMAVRNEYEANRYSWSIAFSSNSKEKTIRLDPFNTSCVGIDSKDAYTIQLNVLRVDLWKIICLCSGIILFFSAQKLSKNVAFHYICGILFGICASMLILIYFISKLFPRKPLMYGVLGCGWTIGIYLLQIIWDNAKVIMSVYKTYVMWYIVITGIISFIVCYRWGPVKNQRTINLIKWCLQIVGMFQIYCSSHFQEAAMGQIILLLLIYNMPKKWISKSKSFWMNKFPPKAKLLSNDEYYQQGVIETTKALDELRTYCSSPQCNQWKTALKLKDVKRFASFIEGNSHLSDDEILEYETSMQGELTENETDYSEEEEISF